MIILLDRELEAKNGFVSIIPAENNQEKLFFIRDNSSDHNLVLISDDKIFLRFQIFFFSTFLLCDEMMTPKKISVFISCHLHLINIGSGYSHLDLYLLTKNFGFVYLLIKNFFFL